MQMWSVPAQKHAVLAMHVTLLCCCVGMATACDCCAAVQYREQVSELKQQNVRLKDTVNNLEKRLHEARSRAEVLERKLSGK